MHIITLFIPHSKSTPSEEPLEKVHYIAVFPKTASMFGIAVCNQRQNISTTKLFSDFVFGVIGSIGKNLIRSFSSSTRLSFDRWDSVDHRNCHLRIVDVGSGMFNRQRNTLPVSYQVAFRAPLSPIRRIWPSFRPPKTARTLQLSIADVLQSMTSAIPNSSKNTCQILCYTPAACQSRSLLQHVIPEPHCISFGRYSHGVPDLRTNRIPVNAARSSTGGLPPFGRGGCAGKRGLMRFQSSSGNNSFAMIPSLKRVRVVNSKNAIHNKKPKLESIWFC